MVDSESKMLSYRIVKRYYTLLYGIINVIIRDIETLSMTFIVCVGEVLRGDRIVSTPYKVLSIIFHVFVDSGYFVFRCMYLKTRNVMLCASAVAH